MLSQINAFHTIPSYSFKLHFNSILLSAPTSPSGIFLSRNPTKSLYDSDSCINSFRLQLAKRSSRVSLRTQFIKSPDVCVCRLWQLHYANELAVCHHKLGHRDLLIQWSAINLKRQPYPPLPARWRIGHLYSVQGRQMRDLLKEFYNASYVSEL